MDLSKKASTALVNLKLSADEGTLLPNPDFYRSLVGKLNVLNNTRPNLSFVIQILSQFMHLPRSSHLQALHHTLGHGILLKGSDHLALQTLIFFIRIKSHALILESQLQVIIYCLIILLSHTWKSKKQSTISKSFSEAELGVHNIQPVTLHCDNQSALHIAKNPVFHEMTKHIEIDCHFTREKVLEGLLQLSYLPTQSQLADVFTKSMPSPQFYKLLSKLGLFDPSSHPPPNLRRGRGIGDTTQADGQAISQQRLIKISINLLQLINHSVTNGYFL